MLDNLGSSKTELYLSPISIWELTVLVSKRRIILNNEVGDWVSEALSLVPITEIPLTISVALEAESLSLPHRDPADRFLVATAKVFNFALATADKRLIDADCCDLLAN
jgi:PIN domain nuclease of toxin-antitoxin system